MKQQLEITTITTNGINVNVKIDYANKKISLVEGSKNGYKKKNWLFAEREVGYMKGWVAILGAIEEAISYGNQKLRKFIDEEERKEEIQVAGMLLAKND